ncbi:uncharacterized protein LOC129586280 [Paramacrobiotus metropolitanus]|uniref:uncharacterized protein LOC129586280 n=1 Tax=Paramacrobiotus metropolitanus TaxID=2943436 RepID=UPI002446538A|nr:uncharacterized protein LOC129586280 [Paramacrobiotus metropolitanus]
MRAFSEYFLIAAASLIGCAKGTKITSDSELGPQNFVLPTANIILKCTGGSGLIWKYEDGSLPEGAKIQAPSTQDQSSVLELILSPIRHNGGAYSCIDNAKNKDTINLNVVSAKSLYADPVVGNGTVDTTLRCHQRFSPLFPLIWTFPNGSEIIPGNYSKGDNRVSVNAPEKGSALHLRVASRRDIELGNYECRLNTSGSTLPAEIIAQLNEIKTSVNYEAKPDVKFEGSQQKSKSATKGEPFVLKCIVEGHNDTVKFVKMNEETKENTTLLEGPVSSLQLCEGSNDEYCIPGSTYKVSQQEVRANDTGKLHSVTISMHITETKDEDRGEYICIAKNSAGEHRASTTLRVKDKLAALWPFLGIVGEVVLLCLIIFCYEKRRNKAADDEDENEPMKAEVHETRETNVQRRGK